MKIDDASLLAYVDGELSAEESGRVEKAIQESEEVASRVSLLRASDLPYREAFARQSLPLVPESLSLNVDALIRQHLAGGAGAAAKASTSTSFEPDVDDAQEDVESLGENVHRLKPRARALPQLSWPKLAVAFVAGAFCCGLALRLVPQLAGGNSGVMTTADGSGMTPWIEAAASYQQLYTRDTVALLQPDMSATASTVADINQADNLPVHIPDLRSQGLMFKRVQRLRFHDKPLVQIVYLPQKGKPVALCVLREAKADAAPSSGSVDGMDVVSWRRGELGYALIGEPGAVDLEAIGKQLYGGQVAATISANGMGDDGRRG